MDEASHHDHIQKVNTPIIKPLLEKYGAVAYTVVCLSFAQRRIRLRKSGHRTNIPVETHNDSSARADFDRLFPEAPAGMLVSDGFQKINPFQPWSSGLMVSHDLSRCSDLESSSSWIMIRSFP